MKPVDKKDLPKLYVLVALAVSIFGYFVYAMTFGAETPASAAGNKKDTTKGGAPGTAAATNASGGAPAGGAAGAPSPEQTPVAFDPRVYGPPQGGRDPFQPVGPTAPTQATPAPIANNTPPPPKVPPLFVPPPSVVKPERPRPQNSLSALLGPGSNAGSVKPVEMEPAPVPSMAVTGVVLGDPTSGNPRNVAIMRGNGSEERRFVSVGDYIGNGYTVVAVHADGVEIQDKAGNRRVTIKLGQPGDNARAN